MASPTKLPHIAGPKVLYDHPDSVRETIRHLADADVEELRDLALNLVDDLEAAYGRVAELTLDDGQHVIEFRDDGWTLKHPLACRPQLFDCPVNRAAGRDLVEAPAVLGRFECGLNDLGDRLLIGDRVEGGTDG